MPIPENPQSRSEQYLNAIATGDNSGLPEFPQSRMEQYLEVIAQNGGGSSGGGVLVVTENMETGALDKTWQEIHDASDSGVVVLDGTAYLTGVPHILPKPNVQEEWKVFFATVSNGQIEVWVYSTTDGANSYPTYQE